MAPTAGVIFPKLKLFEHKSIFEKDSGDKKSDTAAAGGDDGGDGLTGGGGGGGGGGETHNE